MSKRYKDWLAQAGSDLEHARKSVPIRDFNWACFASQQSAEKALKALYDFLGGEGWGHSVVKLLRDLPPERAPAAADFLDKAASLDKLYIPTRYPNGFAIGSAAEYYTEQEALQAIGYAGDILSFVESQVR